ncbi:MAG: DUF2145 domain-containing protein [Asticcacaulis sp.]|nr:DUF2145 domain-containing protein [Asticcacaulis sp.]
MKHVGLAALVALTAFPAAATETPHPVADSGLSGRAPAPHFTPVEAAGFAKQIEHDLAGHGARVAIVFRAGKPRKDLPDGIAYTHAAFWVYSDITGSDGKTYKGYASYNLYQGDGKTAAVDQSYLAQDYPLDFVSGDQADDVGTIIPTPEMQRRLLNLIQSPTYQKLHVPSYSLVSSPFDARHQNCTEFVLDVVSSAAWETEDYGQIKADLKAWFTPTIIHANLFQRVFGPMVDPRLKMDDQGDDVETVSYESMAAFMRRYDLMSETYVLNRAPSTLAVAP